MQVKVMNRIYNMGYDKYKGLLAIASEQVPFGIYAIEKKGYAELRNDRCQSMGQLKEKTRQFKAQGFTVKSNKKPFLMEGMKEGLRSAT